MNTPAESPGRPLDAAKLGLLLSLYFSQGLPLGFFAQALPVLLRQQGYSLTDIGLTSLLSLPWALKFLWAPLVDRYPRRPTSRRKSWIVPLQLSGVVVLVGLAAAGNASPEWLFGAVFLLNLIAATQDIATDGLAVSLLSPPERGLANGIQVAGYRVGMIVGGGVLLILADSLGSRGVFLAMAILSALATTPIALFREGPNPAAAATPTASTPTRATPSATVSPQAHSSAVPSFLRRPGAPRILLLIITYKAGEAFASGMLRPFLVDRGLDLADIGWLLGTVGFVAGLLGALAGGGLINRLGRRRSLVVFGLVQAVAVAGYIGLALTPPDALALYAVTALEHFASGLATAALFTCMMDWSHRDRGATDYTVQASAVVIATGGASTLAGASAQALGYPLHFTLAAILALAAVAIVGVAFPRRDDPPHTQPSSPGDAP